jgi:hypothetical protein
VVNAPAGPSRMELGLSSRWMLWVLLFSLPVMKMLLLAAFMVLLWRSNADPGEAVEVRTALGPRRPRAPRPRTGRGGPRRGPASRGPRVPLRR